MPFRPPELPDPEEVIEDWNQMSHLAFPATGGASGQAASRFSMLSKLERLYGALGKPERAFEMALQQMEVQPARIADFNVLEQVAARAEALGRQAAFHDCGPAPASRC